MKQILAIVALLCAVLLSHNAVQAQSKSVFETLEKANSENVGVRIVLENDNEYVGRILELNDSEVKLETSDGSIVLGISKIKKVVIIDANNRSSAWFDNPTRNRLFFTQSGHMLEKGQAFYQNTYIFFSSMNFALTNNVTVSGGFSMFPGLRGEQLLNLGVKAGKNFSEHFAVATTVTYYTFTSAEDGLTTFSVAGTYTKNALDVTLGAGFARLFEQSSEPIGVLGAQYRVAERFAFVTENFFIPSGESSELQIRSFGGRFIGKKMTFDLAFFTGPEFEGYLPFVSFAYGF